MAGSTWDAVVIGGGPAGSSTASFLARNGLRVCVLEGKAFPRHHIGESLLSMSMGYVRELGVEGELEKRGTLRKYGSLFRWGARQQPMVLGQIFPGYAYQVKRADFDDILLRRAAADGAVVRNEHWARELLRRDGRVCGVRGASPSGPFEIRARIIVDASGLPQFKPRRLKLRPGIDGPRRMALSGYFVGAGRPDIHHENDIVTEASENGWLWFIPLERDLTSVGFVTDEGPLIRRPAEMLSREVASTSIIADLLCSARPDSHTRVLRYTNHIVAERLWQRGVVLVGDSAAFIDPLFSTGVHGALHSAALASAAITSFVARPDDEERLADWYDRRAREHFIRVSSLVHLLYRIHPGTSTFWRRRFQPDVPSPEAEHLLRRLGPAGVAFFADSARTESLAIPESLRSRLHEFSRPTSVARLAGDAVVELGDQMVRTPDLMRWRGRAVPALALTHRGNRVQRGEWPLGSPHARLVAAVDGRRTVVQLAEQAGQRVDGPARTAAFLGALITAGHLRLHVTSNERSVA